MLQRNKARRRPTGSPARRQHEADCRALDHHTRPHEVLRQRAFAVLEGNQAAEKHARGRACANQHLQCGAADK